MKGRGPASADRSESYRRIDYGKMIDWTSRLARELPFLVEQLGPPSAAPLFDLGCGPAIHTRALVEKGYRVIGLDRSEAMLERAGKAPAGSLFVMGDLTALPLSAATGAAGAICLGNTLVHFLDDEPYVSLFRALRERITPGGALIIQILNYVRLREGKVRHLPLNFRDGGDGNEAIFLRLLDFLDERRVHFEVVSLMRRPAEETARLTNTTSSILRALRFDELVAFLGRGGFDKIELFGSYGGEPFDEHRSHDVIAVAR